MGGAVSHAQRVAVVGATGLMGRLVCERLADRGYEVVGISRALGVDVMSGPALQESLDGVGTVVDCLNVTTLSRARSVRFFTTAAGRVALASRRSGVGRIVCLSIVNATDPAVQRVAGYYAGKAAQESVYRGCGLPVTLARTTQWYALAETLLSQLAVGRVSFILGMRNRPMAEADAAAFLVEQVEAPPTLTQSGTPGAGPGSEVREAEIAGPDVRDMADLARQVAAVRHPGRRVVRVPVGATALGRGALLPRGNVLSAPTTFEEWLAAGSAAGSPSG